MGFGHAAESESYSPKPQTTEKPEGQPSLDNSSHHDPLFPRGLVASSFVATAGEMPPRRRDRRRPRDPSPPSSDARAPPSASGLRLTLLAPLLLLVLVLAALGFSGLLSRSPPHSRTLQTTAHSVYERGLVKRDVSAREILAVSISRSYCSIQSFVVIAELLARVATDAVPPPPPCCWTT